MPAIYNPEAVVQVWPFSRQKEGNEIIIGRVDIGSFVALSPEAVEVLDYLAEGKSISEAVDWHRQKYGSTPDLVDFLQALEENGIIKTRDLEGKPVAAPKPQTGKRYYFSSIPQSVAQCIFSFPVILTCCLLIAGAMGTLVRIPTLIAHPWELYVPDHRTLTFAILVVVGYASVIVHEFSHIIATRAQGINSRLGFGHRLWNLVAEADLTGLWSVPKRRRLLPLLAGSLYDALMGALLTYILFANHEGWLAISAFAVRILRLSLLVFITRIFWQGFIFVRTDYYYLLATLLNCRNLLGDTEDFLRNGLAKVVPWISRVDQSAIPHSERRVIPFFALLWIAGRTLALGWFFRFTVPVLSRYTVNLVHVVNAGYAASPSNYIDSVLLYLLLILPITAGTTLWSISIVRRVKGVLSSSAAA
jgi:hypothetical protein